MCVPRDWSLSRCYGEPGSGPILEGSDAGPVGAVGAAEDATIRLHPMPDHLAATVGADRRHCMDGTLEAIEGVGGALLHDLECFVVVVAADLTSCHGATYSLNDCLTRQMLEG